MHFILFQFFISTKISMFLLLRTDELNLSFHRNMVEKYAVDVIFAYGDSEIVSVRTPRKEITLASSISVLH